MSEKKSAAIVEVDKSEAFQLARFYGKLLNIEKEHLNQLDAKYFELMELVDYDLLDEAVKRTKDRIDSYDESKGKWLDISRRLA